MCCIVALVIAHKDDNPLAQKMVGLLLGAVQERLQIWSLPAISVFFIKGFREKKMLLGNSE